MTMTVFGEKRYLFLFLLHLLQLAQLQQCPARIVNFDVVSPKTETRKFCAVADAGVTEVADKHLDECSRACANNDTCVGFNYVEPQLVCELFQTPFSTLSQTPGCAHYEASRNQKTAR